MTNINNFETIEIENVENLKQPTIYFFLKNNGFSEHYIKTLRNASGAIRLNGQPVNVRTQIKNGDVLQLAKSASRPTKFQPCDVKLEILFEDDDYLIAGKPHNLTCNPTRSHYANNLGSMVCTYMQNKDNNFVLRILNRLDRETAGIVVIAKNVRAYNEMTNFEKEYHAICHGKIEKDFTIDKPILTITHDGINEIKRVVSPDGKRAVTHVYVLRHPEPTTQSSCRRIYNLQKDDYTLIRLTLETGRTHQIRVHLSDSGHPLLGDTLYGKKEEFKNNPSVHTMLILKKISFTHFRTKQKIVLEVPYPDDWAALLHFN